MSIAARECCFCKKQFQPKQEPSPANPKKYCSLKCAQLARRKESVREERICANCKKPFIFYLTLSSNNAARNPGRYCSKACDNEDSRATLGCAKCGKPFTVFACMAKIRKYCSQQCAGTNDRRTAKVCLRCGEKYTVINSQASTSKYCSFLCKVRHEGEQRRKPLEDPKPNRRRLQSKAWRELRAIILERDGYSCKRCGTPDNLQVHHLVRWKISHNNDPSNLVTLCLSCHRIIEPISHAANRISLLE